MIDGFKKFISRGNMIDMAVGVVMGAAVTAVVNTIVESLIKPLIAMIFGKADMNGVLAFTVNDATVSFGAIIGAIINFLVIAAAVYFFILVPINKLRDMSASLLKSGHEADIAEEEKAPLSAEEQTVLLLQEIRDSLASGSGQAAVQQHTN